MFGAEVVIGYLAAWAFRKGRRLGERLDSEADAAMDAGLDRLHELVARKLEADPALAKFESEAQGGEISERTRTRVALALEDAVEADPEFAAAVEDAAGELERAREDGASVVTITQSAIGQQNVQLADVRGTVSISFGGKPSGMAG